jgi:hypothetical protein
MAWAFLYFGSSFGIHLSYMGTLTNHVILDEYKLIVECFSGEIGPEEIIAQKERTRKDASYNPRYSVLEDIRNAHMLHTRQRIMPIVTWLKENNPVHKNAAILTEKPEQVVAAELFVENSMQLHTNIKVFSTLAAALFWLGVKHLNDRSLEELIGTMKNPD